MLSSMNQHKYLEMIEIEETYKDCLRMVIAEAVTIETSVEVTEAEEPNASIRDILKGSKPIEVTDRSARYEIIFDNYIAYAVTNESYAGNIEEEYEGKLARIYSKSAFLNYVSQGTIATPEYPGPFKHYGFCCLNQIIDIVSEEPPIIKKNTIQEPKLTFTAFSRTRLTARFLGVMHIGEQIDEILENAASPR